MNKSQVKEQCKRQILSMDERMAAACQQTRIRNAYQGQTAVFFIACHTVVIYVENSNVIWYAQHVRKQTSHPIVLKKTLYLKVFSEFCKLRKKCYKQYLPWKLQAPVIYHLGPPSMSFLWLQDHLESKGCINLPSYLDQTLMVLLPKNKKTLCLWELLF